MLSVDLRDGNLNVDPLSLDVNGGSATGRFSLEQANSLATVSIGLDAEQIRMGTAEEDETYGAPPPLDIMVDMSGSGKTIQELAVSTVGQATVIQGAGRRGADALGLLDQVRDRDPGRAGFSAIRSIQFGY